MQGWELEGMGGSWGDGGTCVREGGGGERIHQASALYTLAKLCGGGGRAGKGTRRRVRNDRSGQWSRIRLGRE